MNTPQLRAIQKHHRLWFLTSMGFLSIMSMGLTDSIIDNCNFSSKKLKLSDGVIINEIGIGIILGVSFLLFLWTIYSSIKFYKKQEIKDYDRYKLIYAVLSLIILLGLASSVYEFSKSMGLHQIKQSEIGNKIVIITLSVAIIATLLMLIMNHLIGKKRITEKAFGNTTIQPYFNFKRGIVGALFLGTVGMVFSAAMTKHLLGTYIVPTIVCSSIIFGLAGLYLFGGSPFKKNHGAKIIEDTKNNLNLTDTDIDQESSLMDSSSTLLPKSNVYDFNCN